jgi:GH25 family lysozyme M1 (1,4-beta-N-acetylmuramidase)
MAYYFSFKSNKIAKRAASKNAFAIFQVLENKGSKVVGIDVSEYKGEIDGLLD